MDATWHSGPRGSTTRTRTAPTWRIIHIYYIYILYINGSLAFPIWEGLLIALIVGYYKTDDLLYFFPCGTNPHTPLTCK